MMDRSTDRLLMRLLHRELPAAEAAELQRRLRQEPDLKARYQRLEALWRGLELPPPAPVPSGFATRVTARLAPAAPLRLRPRLAAAVLALGLGLGMVLGGIVDSGLDGEAGWSEAPAGEVAAAGDWALETSPSSLADEYWRAVDEVFGAPEIRR